MHKLQIDHGLIESRKSLRRRLWDYQPVDHIPVMLWLTPSCGYTLHQQLQSTEIQFRVNSEAIRRSLRTIPDDYIPFARVNRGYMTVATMFGIEPSWGDDPGQPPGIAGSVIHNLADIYDLPRPDLNQGIIPEMLARLRYHAQHLPPDVYITGINVGGPLQACRDLIDTNLFYTSFYDNPEAMHYLLGMVADVQDELLSAVVVAAGGIDRMTSIDWDPDWAPESYKSHVGDDVAANIGPRIYRLFSLPYNNRLFGPWGSGLIHNCGPNPCWPAYLEHEPRLKGINCAYRFSRADFPRLRQVFAGWGIVEVNFDCGESADEMLEGFRTMMETLAPDTVGIPICMVDDGWSDGDITSFYQEMRAIAEEYAGCMNWRERTG